MIGVRKIATAALLAALGVALPAPAQDRGADWLKKPTAEDLYSVWPTAAWAKGEGGKAVVRCTVTTVGALRECAVKSESPPGSGFGDAALALTSQFLMRPAVKNGQAVASEVNIPITFESPGKRLGSLVSGPESGSTIRIFRALPWLEAPSVADMQAAYPPKAIAAKTTGYVTLQCKLNKQGRMTGCDTLTEEPKGLGLAQAARGLVSKFRGPTQDAQGKPLEGEVQIRLTFSPDMLGANPVIGKPDWAALPAAQDLAAVIPEEAKKAGVLKARVLMACIIGADGGLTNCKVESEEPPGVGYGPALLTLARSFRMSLWSTEGLPTIGGTVRVPIRFDFSGDPPPAKP